MIELVFQMPELRPTRGTQRWVKYMCKNVYQTDFRDMTEFPKIFRAAYKVHRASFNKNGRPKLTNKDVLSWNRYGSPRGYFSFLRGVSVVCPYAYMHVSLHIHECVLTHTCMCPYTYMNVSSFYYVCVLTRLCEQVSHNFAINCTRNAGFFPVCVSAEDPGNLTNKTFDNFAKVLYFYYITYCMAEALGTTSKEAREALLYLHYVTPEHKGKKVPCVNIIHRCMQSGTYR